MLSVFHGTIYNSLQCVQLGKKISVLLQASALIAVGLVCSVAQFEFRELWVSGPYLPLNKLKVDEPVEHMA